jgi:predicted transcriptional regulator
MLKSMDEVFKALADPVRCQLLNKLHDDNDQTLTELCEEQAIMRQAVPKHISILEMPTSLRR